MITRSDNEKLKQFELDDVHADSKLDILADDGFVKETNRDTSNGTSNTAHPDIPSNLSISRALLLIQKTIMKIRQMYLQIIFLLMLNSTLLT